MNMLRLVMPISDVKLCIVNLVQQVQSCAVVVSHTYTWKHCREILTDLISGLASSPYPVLYPGAGSTMFIPTAAQPGIRLFQFSY